MALALGIPPNHEYIVQQHPFNIEDGKGKPVLGRLAYIATYIAIGSLAKSHKEELVCSVDAGKPSFYRL
jgi:hypothetical protein